MISYRTIVILLLVSDGIYLLQNILRALVIAPMDAQGRPITNRRRILREYCR